MAIRRKGLLGVGVVLTNLNLKVLALKGRTVAATREGILVIKKRSQELTPIDTGDLRTNVQTWVKNTTNGPVATIHYSQEYALFVHEIDKNYTVGQWKFLEQALKDTERRVLHVLARKVKFR